MCVCIWRMWRVAQNLFVQVTIGISGLSPSCNASPEKNLMCWKVWVCSYYNPKIGFWYMQEFLANATSSPSLMEVVSLMPVWAKHWLPFGFLKWCCLKPVTLKSPPGKHRVWALGLGRAKNPEVVWKMDKIIWMLEMLLNKKDRIMLISLLLQIRNSSLGSQSWRNVGGQRHLRLLHRFCHGANLAFTGLDASYSYAGMKYWT